MKSFFRESKSNIEFRKTTTPDFPAHLHEEIELIYVKKGSATAYVDGKEYSLSDNMFFLCFPNQVHSYEKGVQGEYILLLIKPSRLFHYNSTFLELVPTSASLCAKEEERVVSLLEESFREFQQSGESSVVICYITLIFGKLLKQYTLENSEISQDCVSNILNFCAQHYKEKISLTDISEALHISRSHISRLFSKRISMNFCDYINSLRLVDALNMLENKDLSMTQVAYKSGFLTLRTFNRAFLKRYGISPSEYKKQIKK